LQGHTENASSNAGKVNVMFIGASINLIVE
jgi:hypothetical protein